jgi:hypothetical protein
MQTYVNFVYIGCWLAGSVVAYYMPVCFVTTNICIETRAESQEASVETAHAVPRLVVESVVHHEIQCITSSS